MKVHDYVLCVRGAAQNVGGVPSPEPDLSRLRDIFVTARAESGMTFEQLAEASGLHRQTLTNIARGAAKGDLRTWLMLARAFDATLDELLAPVWHDSAS
nr:helix-turn-helix transcriptional regulator [Dermacoccus sp. Ellin185]